MPYLITLNTAVWRAYKNDKQLLLPYTKYLNKKVSKKENFVYIFCGDKVFYFERLKIKRNLIA
jgi:hypothetical protein